MFDYKERRFRQRRRRFFVRVNAGPLHLSVTMGVQHDNRADDGVGVQLSAKTISALSAQLNTGRREFMGHSRRDR
jgi:hypothetical protein